MVMPKTDGSVTRARAKRREVIKLAEKLIDMLEPYRRDAIQVLIDGMKATRPVYVRGQVVGEEPDWKERRENAALILAYVEGRPVERQIQARGDFEDLEALRNRIASLPSLQNTLEGQRSRSSSP
jgi:hypothetical protein